MSTLLGDGTPVADILAELAEAKQTIQQYKAAFRRIESLCNAPHWSASRRWDIEEIARTRGARMPKLPRESG